VPFTHTTTHTTCYGIPHFNPGTSLYLVEDRAPLPGELFIWCQKSFEGFPTAPVWGRFMASTPKGDKVLTTMGDVVVLPLGPGPLPTKTDYAYRFRIVGNRFEGFGDRLYARSEIPIPVPTTGETIDPAAAFDMVHHAVKQLDTLLGNMSDVSDMADELAEAEKADAETVHNCRQRCRARAYTTLQPILNAALEQSARVERELADFLKASPVLARHLAHWQSDD
jgi:hypothetical protein